MFVRHMFKGSNAILTLITFILGISMIGLGIWQINRHGERQLENATLRERLAAEPLVIDGSDLPDDLETLEYRDVVVRGQFDHSQEAALINQTHFGIQGVRLLTPLVIEGSQRAILVDRGFVPGVELDRHLWDKYRIDIPVEITGIVRLTQPRFLAAPPTQEELGQFTVDIDRIQTQISHELLPVYISQTLEFPTDIPPFPTEVELDLSSGPHASYAIQWFAFTLILLVAYVYLIRQQIQKEQSKTPRT